MTRHHGSPFLPSMFSHCPASGDNDVVAVPYCQWPSCQAVCPSSPLTSPSCVFPPSCFFMFLSILLVLWILSLAVNPAPLSFLVKMLIPSLSIISESLELPGGVQWLPIIQEHLLNCKRYFLLSVYMPGLLRGI